MQLFDYNSKLQTVSQMIENGKKLPSIYVVYNIVQYFDLSLGEFFSCIDEKMKK